MVNLFLEKNYTVLENTEGLPCDSLTSATMTNFRTVHCQLLELRTMKFNRGASYCAMDTFSLLGLSNQLELPRTCMQV